MARKYVGPNGKVVGVDLLDMDPIDGIDFIKGDFRDPKIVEQIQERTEIQGLDLVISDMAPNMTGITAIDQPKGIYLAELALDMAKQALKPGGSIIFKVFQGEGFEQLLAEIRSCFAKVVTRKPAASRPRSREVYLVAKAYK